MKILLAYRSGRPGAGDRFARRMPVGLGYINAALRKERFDSRLANLSGLPRGAIRDLLRRERPDLLGLTLYTFNRHASLGLAAAAKAANPRCFVVVGGPHAAHLPRSLLEGCPQIDAVATGEGEELMVDLARCLEGGGDPAAVTGLYLRAPGGAVFTGAREPISSLDALPSPAPWYDGFHLDVAAEAGFIITSRGCPGRCTFCNTPDFWGTRIRFRGPESILEEMRHLAREMGILHISIRDDTFTVHRRRLLDLCARLEEARLGVLWNCQSRVNAIDEERLTAMRSAGCDVVQYGVESGSPRILALLSKDITVDQVRAAAAATRRAGIHLSIYLISGVPAETDEDFAATAALVRQIRPHDAIVAPLAVYPGTALWDAHKAAHRLGDDYWLRERRGTLYAMPAGSRARSQARLARVCLAAASPYSREELEAHKRLLPGAFAPLLSSGLAWEAEACFGQALGEYAAILRGDPANPWALIRSAAVLAGSGDPRGAVLYAAQLTRAHPRYAAGHAILAEANLAAGRRGKAREAALRAVSLDPRDPIASRLLRALRVVGRRGG